MNVRPTQPLQASAAVILAADLSTQEVCSSIEAVVDLLAAAQRLERRLWSSMPELGGDQCVLAEAAEAAWVRLHKGAEAVAAAPLPGPRGREQRLAAVLLLAVLDAAEPGQVSRLQAQASTLLGSAETRSRRRSTDAVDHLLRAIARGPFVVSGAATEEADAMLLPLVG